MAFSSAVIGMVLVAVAAAVLAAAATAAWQQMRMSRCRCVTGILDSSTDGVFAVDQDWHLTYMNDRARVLLNAPYAPEGKGLWDVVSDAVTVGFGPACRQAMEQQELVESAVFHPPLEAWFAVCAYPIPNGLAVTFRDITAGKRREAERERMPAPDPEPIPHLEDVPLAGLMEKAAAVHQASVEGRGLAWQPGQTVDGTVMVRSDRALLLRMIGGVIGTAMRQSPGGAVGLGCRISPRAVQIVVRSTATFPPGETGLEAVLPLSRRLNHPVDVMPAVGQGMEWTITVPRGQEVPSPSVRLPQPPIRAAAAAVAGLGQPPQKARPSDPSKAGRDGGRCILLVDDDPIVLMGLEAVLSDWGYEIVTAASADQAMERLASGGQQPDIVMADYQLRNNRVGTEVVSRVRERFGPVPGVILTGETGGTCLAEAEAMGLAVMVKPVTPQQLAAALGAIPAP